MTEAPPFVERDVPIVLTCTCPREATSVRVAHWLRDRGFEVVVGQCMSADQVRSAPKAERAAELVDLLCDPSVAAVVPPWGGELAIDLLDQIEVDPARRTAVIAAIRAAFP